MTKLNWSCAVKKKIFKAKLYSGDKHIGEVCAKSLPALKRAASRKCNNYFNVVDEMVLMSVKPDCQVELKFTRINRKSPNNTIERGQWR